MPHPHFMTLRLLNTADNHIGLSFHQYPEVARERLNTERFASIERLVTTANERKADFFVVAGDLFDKTSVTKTQVERAVHILGKFEGEAVLVLAGNHDFCEGPDSKLWKQFRAAADGSRVLALAKQNWPDSVRDTLEPLISGVYGVRLHTSVTPNDPEAFRFDWKGKTIDLREHLPAGQTSFSTFHEL